jgi:6-pyruvoyltetrahydropterin/6-carboxytetrahydropterin synthase
LDAEPSAENLLLFIRNSIRPYLPEGVTLSSLRLYETADSFAEWVL